MAAGRRFSIRCAAKGRQLKQSLAALKAADADLSVVVRGAASVDYQKVISVLDILQVLEIAKVGLATETVP